MLPSLMRRRLLEGAFWRPRAREVVVDRGVLGLGAMVSTCYENDLKRMISMMNRGRSQRVARRRRRGTVWGRDRQTSIGKRLSNMNRMFSQVD